MLPEIRGSSGSHYSAGVDQIADLEDACPNRRDQLDHSPYDPVIERVDGVRVHVLGMTAKAAYHLILDTACLDLDEHAGSTPNGFEGLVERGDPGVSLEANLRQVFGVERSDRPGAIRTGHDRIMVNEQNVIDARVYVELDGLCAGFDRGDKCRDRVFGERVVETAVRNGAGRRMLCVHWQELGADSPE